MPCDYRALCVELFGTDNEAEIRSMVCAKNTRLAGRKRKFSTADIAAMSELRSHGVTINEIAKRYHTSRQVVGKYLNTKPANGYTMRMTYMFRNSPCTDIDINFLDRKVQIKNYTDDLLHRAFGIVTNPTWEDFEDFLQYRCFPRTRGNVKDLLRELGLSNYDPLQIVEKTRGRITDDDMWLKVKYYDR